MYSTREIFEYDRKRNKMVLLSWGIIVAVLSLSYIIEYFNGNRTSKYVCSYIAILLVPLIVTFIYSQVVGYKASFIKYMVSFFYLFAYAYTMFTTVSSFSFIYIFPIITVLIVYMDKKLVIIDYSIVIIINILSICYNIYLEGVTKIDIVMYEQQMACVLLCALFMYKTCGVLIYSHNYMLKLDKEIDIDILTSTKNRHYLKNLLSDYFKQDANISLAVIDIDNFKGVNDTYGHNFGDLVLRRVSKILLKNLEGMTSHHVVRTGGDEFLILGIAVDENELYKTCIKICEDVSNLVLKYNNETLSVNISIGVSNSIDDSCYTYKDLYDEADAQLYVAKNNGKNSVVHKERLGVKG